MLARGQSLGHSWQSVSIRFRYTTPVFRHHLLIAGQGRRYFRLLKWYPCFNSAINAYVSAHDAIGAALEMLKYLFLSAYFFLEATTIVCWRTSTSVRLQCLLYGVQNEQTNVMGITTYTWGPEIQQQANRCWVYGLVASIMLSLYILSLQRRGITREKTRKASKADVNGKEKPKLNDNPSATVVKDESNTAQTAQLYEQLIIDACDLLTPGTALGWIKADLAIVGAAMTLSSFLGAQQIWRKLKLE